MAVGVAVNNYVHKTQMRIVPCGEVAFKKLKTNTGIGIRQLYKGDNLNVLRRLVDDESVCGKVNLIYIDPPYNTGGAFETRDFKYAYNDSFPLADYMQFMRARLELMYKLLADTGSIYVHLDGNMVFHVKVMMDEILGMQNFKGMITRKKCKSKNFTRKTYGNISDYILFYTKTSNPVWNRPYEQWDGEKVQKEYPFVENGTGRRYKHVPLHAPGKRNGATGGEWKGMLPPEGKHWQFTPEKLDEMEARGEIHWSSNGNPRRKVYLDNSKGVPVQDIWLDFLDVNNQNTHITGYPTEKNIDMLKRIIETSSNPGDLVLDCFAGSGTTLVAAEELGRQWIGADIGDEAIQTIERRFLYGTQPMGDYTKKRVQPQSLFDDEILHPVQMPLPKSQSPSYDFFEEQEN